MPVTVQQTMAAHSCRRQERWQPSAPAAGTELLWLGAAQSLLQPRSLLLQDSLLLVLSQAQSSLLSVHSPPGATS